MTGLKVAGGAVAGATVAGSAIYGVEKLKRRGVEKRLGSVDKQRQKRAINRVAVLKHVAWCDDMLADSERLFLYDFILASPDLQADIKIQLMLEMDMKPACGRFFAFLPRSYKKKDFVASQEEADGFVQQLVRMAEIDGFYDSREEGIIKRVMGACGVGE